MSSVAGGAKKDGLDGAASLPLAGLYNEIDRLRQELTAEHALRDAIELEVLNLNAELARYKQEIESLHLLYLPYFIEYPQGADGPTIGFVHVKGQQLLLLDQSEDGALER